MEDKSNEFVSTNYGQSEVLTYGAPPSYDNETFSTHGDVHLNMDYHSTYPDALQQPPQDFNSNNGLGTGAVEYHTISLQESTEVVEHVQLHEQTNVYPLTSSEMPAYGLTNEQPLYESQVQQQQQPQYQDPVLKKEEPMKMQEVATVTNQVEVDLTNTTVLQFPDNVDLLPNKDSSTPPTKKRSVGRWRVLKLGSYMPSIMVLILTPIFFSAFIMILIEWDKKSKTKLNRKQRNYAYVGTFLGGFLLLMSVAYYYTNSLRCGTLQFLRMKGEDIQVYQYIEDMRARFPYLAMHVECYHWETRTRYVTYTDSQGRTHTRVETYQVKVVTYRETRTLAFTKMTDASLPFGLDKNTMKKYIKLYLYKAIMLGDDITRLAVENAKARIVIDNRYRDTHISYSDEYCIDGYRHRVMADIDAAQTAPLFGYGWFWLFTVLGLTLPYRIYVNLRCHAQEYTLIKTVSVMP